MMFHNTFDPILITSQIIAVQSLFYLFEMTLVLFVLIVAGKPISLDYIFDFRKISLNNSEFFASGFIWDISSIFGVFIFFFIIQRSKQVLDFTLTMHFIHFIIVFFYSGHFPSSTSWWIVQIISCISICLGGEWMCMQRELKPISFGTGWQSLPTNEPGSHVEQYELNKIETQKYLEAIC
ncbi:hypothetical protein PCK1_002866 [Pneumocystis canis]|nr:hypothetical protein PCK1_002866 [Pneumocystis canis]